MFFLKNHTQNVEEKLFPGLFRRNQIWAYLWINSLKFYAVSFYHMTSWELLKYIETKLRTTLLLLHKKLFYETKRGVELVSLPHFLHDFYRKSFLFLYSITWLNFIAWLSFLLEISGNMFIVIGCWIGLTS